MKDDGLKAKKKKRKKDILAKKQHVQKQEWAGKNEWFGQPGAQGPEWDYRCCKLNVGFQVSSLAAWVDTQGKYNETVHLWTM